MEKSKNNSTPLIVIGIIIILLLGTILYNSYAKNKSSDSYYRNCLQEAGEYAEKKDWDMVLYEIEKLDGIVPKDEKLMEQRDLMKSNAELNKCLNND
ncbi:hypothetical protein [Clostridium sp. KNHs214]|uniref:hypothetical protein n=1 Tax=Clostridium sp. KNHs214 TaxID=1540257 RepID=UPI0005549352|nr:hypothetical protein [Clostridium sp. KNHs214]